MKGVGRERMKDREVEVHGHMYTFISSASGPEQR